MTLPDGTEIYFESPLVDDKEVTLAEWREDKKRIEVYFGNLKSCEKTPEFLAWLINHEFLEGLILAIEKEEKMYSRCPQGIWDHFPFACGLDEIYNFSYFDFKILPIIKYQGVYVLRKFGGKRIYLSIDFANKMLRFRGICDSPIQMPQPKLIGRVHIEEFSTNSPIYPDRSNS